jgi:hypothetical protein
MVNADKEEKTVRVQYSNILVVLVLYSALHAQEHHSTSCVYAIPHFENTLRRGSILYVPQIDNDVTVNLGYKDTAGTSILVSL